MLSKTNASQNWLKYHLSSLIEGLLAWSTVISDNVECLQAIAFEESTYMFF